MTTHPSHSGNPARAERSSARNRRNVILDGVTYRADSDVRGRWYVVRWSDRAFAIDGEYPTMRAAKAALLNAHARGLLLFALHQSPEVCAEEVRRHGICRHCEEGV